VRKRFAGLAIAVLSVTALALALSMSAAATAGNAPITLMDIGPINAPGFSLPSIPVGAQVAINQINKAGGINKHRLVLITCNDMNNPNTATGCAHQAITDKVAAVVGGLSIFDLNIVPYLQQAKIPWIGESTPDAYTQSNMFVVGSAGIIANVGIGEAAVAQGCRKVAVVLSAQSAPVAATQMTAGVHAAGHGATVVGTWTAPATNPDWASIVSALRGAGADCIDSQTGPTETGGLITAVRAGSPLKMFFLSGGIPTSLISQLGAAANGVFVAAGTWPETTNQGAMPYLVDRSQALAPTVPFDEFLSAGYLSVNIFAQAAKGLKTVTAAAILKALPKVHGYNTGLGPTVSLQKAPDAGYPRIFDTDSYLWVARNGNFYLYQKKAVNTAAGLRLLPPAK
jgi:ABC-type branched-subunit amino acid transport system substrate-binding protein